MSSRGSGWHRRGRSSDCLSSRGSGWQRSGRGRELPRSWGSGWHRRGRLCLVCHSRCRRRWPTRHYRRRGNDSGWLHHRSRPSAGDRLWVPNGPDSRRPSPWRSRRRRGRRGGERPYHRWNRCSRHCWDSRRCCGQRGARRGHRHQCYLLLDEWGEGARRRGQWPRPGRDGDGYCGHHRWRTHRWRGSRHHHRRDRDGGRGRRDRRSGRHRRSGCRRRSRSGCRRRPRRRQRSCWRCRR